MEDMAPDAGLPGPVLRACPTGMAAYIFLGRTIHSLLKIPVGAMRNSALTTAQLAHGASRFVQRCLLPHFGWEVYDRAWNASIPIHVFYTKAGVRQHNERKLAALNTPVKLLKARNTGPGAKNATEDKTENLNSELLISIGAKVTLNSNLWVECGLVNGSMGTVVDFSWKAGGNPDIDLPEVILVRFDKYDGPVLNEELSTVPIFTNTAFFKYEGKDCTRKMFPLRLAFTMTVHRSLQGATLSRLVGNLNGREFATGLTYVLVSRVKKLSHLMFTTPFSHHNFIHDETRLLIRWREEDRMLRTSRSIN